MAQVSPAWAGGSQQTSPTITLSPATAQPNQAIAIAGQGFTTGGGGAISSITLGGVAIAGEKINFGKPVTIDHGGNFVANLIVPVNSATLSGGSPSVAVVDSGGKSASAALTIPAPAITVSPAASRVATTVAVTGANFPRYSSSVGADNIPEVTVEYEVTLDNFRLVAAALPDSAGSFSVSFTVPAGAAAPSTDNRVRATVSGSTAQTIARHSILGPSFTVSPAAGPPGTTVTIQGSNFRPFMAVQSLSLGNLGVEIPAGIHTDAAGAFSAAFQVPAADGGAQPLVVQVDGLQYTQSYTVEGDPTLSPADGYTPAPLTVEVAGALRLLEGNLLRIFYFDNATKKWSFYDPRPEVAYFNTLTRLVEGQPYWIGVRRDQTPIIQGSIRSLTAGWNLTVW